MSVFIDQPIEVDKTVFLVLRDRKIVKAMQNFRLLRLAMTVRMLLKKAQQNLIHNLGLDSFQKNLKVRKN